MKNIKIILVKIFGVFLLVSILNSCDNVEDENLIVSDRFIGNVVLNSQSDIDEFGARNYKEITGYLYIGSYDQDSRQITPFDTDINDLSMLSGIERVRGDLFIRGNPNLLDLNGFDNLKIIEGFVFKISLNENLATISGFNNLESIGKTLLIVANESLIDFCGLRTLAENDSDIDFLVHSNEFNPSLEEISDTSCIE